MIWLDHYLENDEMICKGKVINMDNENAREEKNFVDYPVSISDGITLKNIMWIPLTIQFPAVLESI